KVNEPMKMLYTPLLESLHKNLEVTKKEILEQEFSVFSSLEFELYLHNQEYMPHFERLLTNLNIKNKQEYLGDNPFYEINYSKRNNDIDL
ncbi:16382_t:CDS:2, partial [Entrophospora sp. SA101]